MIPKKFHLYPFTVTFDLIDMGGVVYHPNYLILCERARVQAMKDAGYPFEELLKDGYAIVLRENTSKYKRPLRLGDRAVVVTTGDGIQGVDMVLDQQIYAERDFSEIASGYISAESFQREKLKPLYILKVTLVPLQLSTFRPTRWPEKLLTALGF